MVSLLLKHSFSLPLSFKESSMHTAINKHYQGPDPKGQVTLKVFLSLYRAADLKAFRSHLVSASRHICTVSV